MRTTIKNFTFVFQDKNNKTDSTFIRSTKASNMKQAIKFSGLNKKSVIIKNVSVN